MTSGGSFRAFARVLSWSSVSWCWCATTNCLEFDKVQQCYHVIIFIQRFRFVDRLNFFLPIGVITRLMVDTVHGDVVPITIEASFAVGDCKKQEVSAVKMDFLDVHTGFRGGYC